MALVEPPSAMSTAMALSKDAEVTTSRGLRSSHTICTTRRPHASAMREWFESTAGIDEEPGSARPSTSTRLIIVAAVPMVMQVPAERAMPSSISPQASSSMLPARSSAQYFQESLPLPSVVPRQFPRSIGPAGMNTAGRFIDSAPMMSAGVVLSHPPISTQPSAG